MYTHLAQEDHFFGVRKSIGGHSIEIDTARQDVATGIGSIPAVAPAASPHGLSAGAVSDVGKLVSPPPGGDLKSWDFSSLDSFGRCARRVAKTSRRGDGVPLTLLSATWISGLPAAGNPELWECQYFLQAYLLATKRRQLNSFEQ